MGPVGDKPNNEPSLVFGAEVEAARKRKGLTQVQLAAKVGLTQARVSQIEGGKVDASNTIFKLCRILDMVPPRSMFADDDEYEWFQAGRKIRSLNPDLFAIQLSLARAMAEHGPKKPA